MKKLNVLESLDQIWYCYLVELMVVQNLTLLSLQKFYLLLILKNLNINARISAHNVRHATRPNPRVVPSPVWCGLPHALSVCVLLSSRHCHVVSAE